MKHFKRIAAAAITAITAFTLTPRSDSAVNHLSSETTPETRLITITKINDGDTVVAETQDGFLVKLRLRDIDAPEKSQAFGKVAKRHLAALCLNKDASYEELSHDQYDRNLVRLNCGGVDANKAMIEAGLAWVYVKYSQDTDLLALEDDARRNCKGLWKEGKIIAPWDFRKANDKRRNAEITPRIMPKCSQRLAGLAP